MSPLYDVLRDNPIIFGKKFFPHYFRNKSPYFHWLLIHLSYENKFFAVQAPRGSAKSTVLAFLKVTHSICFKRKRFIVIVQNTYKKAAGTLDGIKDEIRWNQEIGRTFGIKLEKDAEGDTIFTHPDGFRTRILCKGVEQIGAIRGERFGAYRPDYILGDDMEDDEMVKSAERRQSLKDLYDNALIPAGDIKCLDVDIIGTILHDDSLMADLVNPRKYTQYCKKFFKARAKNSTTGIEESLWPERWTIDELNEMERQQPETFAKEMQGDPSSGSLETIRRDDFRLWRMEEGQAVLYGSDMEVVARWSIKECKCAVGIDLAWEEGKASDYSAIVPGFVTPANDILVDDYIAKKGMRPDELENILFDMDARYYKMTGSRICFGFEKAKLEKVMKWFLKEAMKRRGKYLWFRDIEWGTRDKIERIMFRVGNRYAQHSIYHKKGMGDLENQLIRLRSAAHDDLCLTGDTWIKTDKGNVRLYNIKVGDLVLTRNGYQKVLRKIYSGRKEVIQWLNLIGTPNHPIITKKGIKILDSLHVCDILYIWNEKLSSIEEKSTIDILNQREGNIEYTSGDMINGKNLQLPYIEKFTQIVLAQYQKAISFIIRMRTRLIMTLQILNVYPDTTTCLYMQANQKELLQRERQWLTESIQKKINKKQENGTQVQKEVSGIVNMDKKHGKIEKHLLLNALYAIKNLMLILKEHFYARLTVGRNTGTGKREVWNLEVQNCNEYFANNILVHNCDSLSMLPEMLYAPHIVKPKAKNDDEFNWWRQVAISRKRGMLASEAEKGSINEHANPHTNTPTGIQARKIAKKPFIFGSNGLKKSARVPCQVSYR